jgi:hypothetical protein
LTFFEFDQRTQNFDEQIPAFVGMFFIWQRKRGTSVNNLPGGQI